MKSLYCSAAKIYALVVFMIALLFTPKSLTALQVEMVSQWGGKCKGIALSEDKLYLGKGQQMLVIDVSGSIPKLIATTPYLKGIVESIGVIGSNVYVACSNGDTGGLQQVSVENQANPKPAFYYNNYRPATDVVCTNEGFIYTSFGGRDIPCVSVFCESGDGAFVNVGGKSMEDDPALSLAVAGQQLYVTNLLEAMGSYNIVKLDDNSIAIQINGRYQNPFINPTGIVVDGSYAYIADSTVGVRTVDVSVPNPRPIAFCPTQGDAQDLIKQGNRIYVANGDSGITLLDASNSPTLMGLSSFCPDGFVQGIALSGDTIYAAGTTPGLSVVDFSVPSSPKRITTPLDTLECGEIKDIAIRDNYVITASGKGGLDVIDIANPEQLTKVGGINTNGCPVGLCLSGDYAYVADSNGILEAFNISVPTKPTPVQSWNIFTPAGNVSVLGNYAFVPYEEWYHGFDSRGVLRYLYSGGFTVINVSTPSASNPIAYRSLHQRIRKIATVDHYLYLATDDFDSDNPDKPGLYIYDIEHPNNPTQRWFYSEAKGIYDIAITGSYAYAACGKDGLLVFDISNPESPVVKNTPQSGLMDARAVCLKGNIAYVTDASSYNECLRLIDVTHPEEPSQVGSAPCLVTPSRIATYGNYAIVAQDAAGLTTFHIGNYSPPTVSAITPGVGPNVGVIHISNLSGTGFRNGVSVKLTRAFQNDVLASNICLVSSSQITCDFDLTGITPGLWTVVVTNPDGQIGKLNNSFGIVMPDTTPVYGTNNKSVNTSIMNDASKKWQFRFWGRVTSIDSSFFWLDDGSKAPIKVFAPDHCPLSDGDYITATGTLDIDDSNNQRLLISVRGVRKI